MRFRSKSSTPAIAFLLAIAISQVYVGMSFAEPGSVFPGESVATTPQQTTGILTTQGNKEITVNGTNAISGATIVSGASIETPATVGASVSLVNLGAAGTLEIEPNTKVNVVFDQSSIGVMLTEGCVNMFTKKGTTGEISTPKGSTGKTDPAQDGKIEICPRRSAAPIVPAGAGTGGLFGLGIAAAVAIIARGETAVAVPVAPRGVLY